MQTKTTRKLIIIIAIFLAVNHVSRPYRKQQFTSTGSEDHFSNSSTIHQGKKKENHNHEIWIPGVKLA